jgi:hypothetical protein
MEGPPRTSERRHMQAQPKVNFYTQVSLEAHERRQRIQARTGYSMPQLVAEALVALERSIDRHQGGLNERGDFLDQAGAA